MLTYPGCSLFLDLGRMYNLVSRITDGLGELKKLLETHIHNQGLAAIEKCGEAALNVRTAFSVKLALRGRVQIHMNLFVSSRTPKFTSRPPWTSTRSTTPWSCLPSTTTPALWRHSTRSVIPLRPVHETPDESERLIHFFFLVLQACGRFINNNAVTRMAQSSSKSPELLARYCDSLLKKRYVSYLEDMKHEHDTQKSFCG